MGAVVANSIIADEAKIFAGEIKKPLLQARHVWRAMDEPRKQSLLLPLTNATRVWSVRHAKAILMHPSDMHLGSNSDARLNW